MDEKDGEYNSLVLDINGFKRALNGQVKAVKKERIAAEPAVWFANAAFCDVYITYQYEAGKYQAKAVSFMPEK